MSNLPIQFIDKENSPALLAIMQQFGEHTYVDAELINKFRDGINELYYTLNPDRIITIGTETIVDNEHTYEGYVWQLGGVQIDNTGNPSVLIIPAATVGFKRKDISVFTSEGNIIRVAGDETDGDIVTTPPTPPGTLYFKSYDINGDTVEADPEPPAIDGSIFKQKNESQKFTQVLGGTNAVIDLQTFGQQYYVVIGPVTSIAGFSKALLTATTRDEAPYGGKDFYFENKTEHNVTLKNAFSGVDIPFNLGADLIVPTNGIVWLKYNPNTEKMDLFFKSWTEPVDISGKLDKVTTAGVERVYTINADGSQGTKPTSDFKDVIEGYFNGTNFYTDALFTNLINPESGKIYINIAVTPATQYRWSGSAYVQILGGGVKGFHRFQSPNFSPAANTTYYIGGNNLGLLSTAQTSNLYARVKAMATGKIGKVSFFASAGLATLVGANVYLDNITKRTSLTIANNFSWHNMSAVNYIATSDFLVDKGDELVIRLKIGGDGTGGGGGTNNNFWAELTIE